MSGLHLLIMDPQNDFCDLPLDYRLDSGSKSQIPALPVPGAHADMLRMASLIHSLSQHIDQITVTLDTHRRLDLAHPGFWMRGDGSPVEPFTTVGPDELRRGQILPRLPECRSRVQRYLEDLQASGRYQHMIWPVHCEIGTWGHAVHEDVHKALARWEETRLRNVVWINKGQNPWTEHFSALRAEVPDPEDPSTHTNQDLLQRLLSSDRVIIGGEAGSHCVKATVEHLVEGFPPDRLASLDLLLDAMSPVAGFEEVQKQFLLDMAGKGLQIIHSRKLVEAFHA